MLTGLLKTFLYSILILILLWAAAIFLGPITLKYATQKFYGEQIKFIGLNVSPRLKISAARIEFNNLPLQNIGKSSGFVRAASLSVKSYKEGKLFFELLTGPIEIHDMAKVASTSTLVSIEGLNAPMKMGLLFTLKEAESKGKFFLKSLTGGGWFNPTTKNLHEIDFEAEGIFNNFFDQLSVERASGKISRVDFNQSFDRLISNFSMLLERASTKDGIFYSREVFFRGNLESKDQQLEIRLRNFKFRDEEILNLINLERRGDGSLKDRIGLFDYKANGIDLTQFDIMPSMLSIKQISGEIDVQDIGKIDLFAQGEFEDLELVSGSQYIADLSGRQFDLDLYLNSDHGNLLVKTDFGVNISNDPVVTVNGVLILKLLGQSVIACVLTKCSLEDLALSYNFLAKDTSLIGSSICTEKACSVGNYSHLLKTVDTQGFFSGLMESKVFNPLALIVAQSQLQTGVKVGAGHELKF